MTSSVFFFLAFLIVSLVATSSGTEEVKAQELHYTLNLECDQPFFYWKGDIIQVNVTSNSSVSVTLSLYWNWKTYTENQLIYRNTKTANATWNLPTENQRAGFYRIVANTSDRTITTWKTLIHRTDYVPASLPISYVWDQINYTFQGRTLRAETTEDYLEIKYPKIPFQHRTRFFRNNMSFVIRLDNQTQGWKVDVAYFLMYGCLKWFVNGTLNSPKTFDFQLSHNPLPRWKKQLDSIRSQGNLVFDWSDIRKMKQAFTWNSTTKTLHVTIPSNFFIDPAIFESGFEGADAEWTSTSGAPDLNNTDPVHCGGESGNFTRTVAEGAGNEYAKKVLASTYTELYLRAYVNVNVMAGDQLRNALGIEDEYTNTIAGIGFVSSTGALYLQYEDSGTQTDTSATTISLDTWYCLEIYSYCHDSAGKVNVWLDGVNITDLAHSGIDSRKATDLEEIIVGIGYGWAGTMITADCVVVDSSYIGVEAGGESVTHELTETFNVTDNTITRRSRTITEAETITLTSITSYGTERLFTYTETITINDAQTRGIARLVISPETITLSALTTFGTERLFTYLETLSMVDGQTVRYGLFYVFSETINILDNFNLQIARLVVASESIIINSVHSIALEVRISLVEAFESLNILTGLTTTRVTIPTETTIDDAVAIAAIALIIALCAFVGVGVKSKRE